jgi:hypothetical protein
MGQTPEKLGRPLEGLRRVRQGVGEGQFREAHARRPHGLVPRNSRNHRWRRRLYQQSPNDLLLQSAVAADQPIEELRAKPGRFDLRSADGLPVQLSAHQGKTVIRDFWATWCGPCRKALENSQHAAAKHAGKLVVLGVALEPKRLTRARCNI